MDVRVVEEVFGGGAGVVLEAEGGGGGGRDVEEEVSGALLDFLGFGGGLLTSVSDTVLFLSSFFPPLFPSGSERTDDFGREEVFFSAFPSLSSLFLVPSDLVTREISFSSLV